jgi:hypothetical protein
MIFHFVRRWKLPLLLYGDLSPREEARLRKHVAECKSCKEELDELRLLGSLVSGSRGGAIDEQRLDALRAGLMAAIPSRSAVRRGFDAQEFLGSFLPQRPGIAMAGLAAMLCVGIVCGRYIVPSRGDVTQSGMAMADADEIAVSNLHILGSVDEGREIEILFDATRTMHVKGTLDNPLVQRVIARAIVNGENPGVRLRAASSAVPFAAATGDREIKAALLLAMNSDINDGVRKAALEALLRYPPDVAIRDGLLQVLLADANPGLRVAAINGLTIMTAHGFLPDEGTRQILEDHLRSEKNLFVRTKTKSLINGRIQ